LRHDEEGDNPDVLHLLLGADELTGQTHWLVLGVEELQLAPEAVC
jgi:hypothetical protein